MSDEAPGHYPDNEHSNLQEPEIQEISDISSSPNHGETIVQDIGWQRNIKEIRRIMQAQLVSFLRDRGKMGRWLPLIVVAFIIFASGGGAYLYFNSRGNNSTQARAEKEIRQVVAAISEMMVLPDDETPTLATVTDPEKLKDQPFFAKAKTGDKVLIYANAHKAILYNPTIHKIIEVAPLNTGQ